MIAMLRNRIHGNLRHLSSKARPIHEVLCPDMVGQRVTVNGWVKSTRVQKVNTFIDLDDGLKCQRLQVVADTAKVPPGVSYHSALCVQGVLKRSDHPAQEFELDAEQIDVVTGTRTDYPLQPRKRYDDEYPRTFPTFRAKLNDFACLLRVRSSLLKAVHEFFHNEHFVHVSTPTLTSSDCEGAGEVFMVLPNSVDTVKAMKKESVETDEEAYFDQKVYLTVSGQLHLEAVCNGLSRVYTTSQAFRAELGKSRRHLSEFTMVEAEVAFANDLESILAMQERLVKSSIHDVLTNNLEDVQTYLMLNSVKQKGKKKGLQKDTDFLYSVLEKPFVTMTYQEAMDALQKANNNFKSNPGCSLGKEHELYLVEDFCNNTPVFVVDWPVNTKPFYARQKQCGQLVDAADLLFPDVGELSGGSLREHRVDVLEQAILKSGANLNNLQWYLDMRSCGAAPMGGFGVGFDRLVQFILKVNNIRDAVPFSRVPHSCRL